MRSLGFGPRKATPKTGDFREGLFVLRGKPRRKGQEGRRYIAVSSGDTPIVAMDRDAYERLKPSSVLPRRWAKTMESHAGQMTHTTHMVDRRTGPKDRRKPLANKK